MFYILFLELAKKPATASENFLEKIVILDKISQCVTSFCIIANELIFGPVPTKERQVYPSSLGIDPKKYYKFQTILSKKIC